MVLPIGGFMPIPLAMMIPFMATQSMVMGDAFGRAFQYGKRKISAMSNEEFNKTSLEQQASEMFAAYKIIIDKNHLAKAMAESSELQRVIIKEMLAIIPQFTKDFAQELGQNITTVGDEFAHLVGQHVGHDASRTTVPQIIQPSIPQQKTVSLTETLPISATRANIPPNAQITADQRTKLIAHYKNNIKVLSLKFNQQSLIASSSISSTKRKQAQSAMTAIRNEKVQQNRFLTRVRNWQQPY